MRLKIIGVVSAKIPANEALRLKARALARGLTV